MRNWLKTREKCYSESCSNRPLVPSGFRMRSNSARRASQLPVAFVAACLIPLCFAGNVQVWMEKGANLSQYKTYEWLPPKILTSKGVVEDDPEFAPLIKAAVNRQLNGKGLKEVAQGGELQVSTLALAQSIPQLEALIFANPGTPDVFTAPIATVGRYNREGTLVVNLIDTKTQKSAWCGMAKETIDNKPGAGKKKIDSAAAKLFKKYPKNPAPK